MTVNVFELEMKMKVKGSEGLWRERGVHTVIDYGFDETDGDAICIVRRWDKNDLPVGYSWWRLDLWWLQGGGEVERLEISGLW